MLDQDDLPLEILHLEDNPGDAELVSATLKTAGLDFRVTLAKSRKDFVAAMGRKKFDLIISDFTLPSFNGREALAIAREKAPDTPFVFVSGTIGEDAAIQSLRDGATDYVLKTKLTRLVPAVSRALREADERRKLRLAEKLREMALEDLKQSEARFRGVLEAAPDAVVITDSSDKINFANAQTENVFGYRRDELMGRPLSVLVPDRLRAMHERHMRRFDFDPHPRGLNTGMEFYGRRRDGTEFPADIMLSPIRMEDEIAVLAMVRDVTASKQAEKALRESEERFRKIYETSPVGIVNINPDGKFLRCNPAAAKLFGYSEAELYEKSFIDLTYPDDKMIGVQVLEGLKSGRDEIAELDKRYIRRDGKVIWGHLTATAVRDIQNQLSYALTIIEDVTERKQAEEALRQSERQNRDLVDSARDAIFSLSAEAIIKSLNPAFEALTGWNREDWIGKSFTDLLHPDDRQKAMDMFIRTLRGELSDVVQYKFLKKSGEYGIGELSTTRLVNEGETTGILGIARDVTAQVALEEQLRQAQKMESIGTLAGGIAHDFNNILGIIIGYAGLSKKTFKKDERLFGNMESIESAAQRGVGLVRQLLMFARKQERSLHALNVNDVVADAYKMISETFPRVISVKLELTDTPLLILGDQTEIHQAVLNLCVNARDAMMDRPDGELSGGILTISTAPAEGKEIRARHPSASGDRYIRISVTDTGVGMDEVTRARIFEPFFTTKERGKGTGLGLSTVYGIVSAYEGIIELTSVPGVGTTFSIFLPSHRSADALAAEMEKETGEVQGGSETILVVEDEAGLRELLQDILTNHGYRVLTAQDGQRALALFLDHRNIELVISDIGLPKVGGLDLYQAIRKMKPDIKVILVSGFVDDADMQKMQKGGVNRFIQKPYQPLDVLRKVREVLDEKRK